MATFWPANLGFVPLPEVVQGIATDIFPPSCKDSRRLSIVVLGLSQQEENGSHPESRQRAKE
jgi:hypothetical protein